MRHIEIAAVDNRFTAVKICKVCSQVIFKFHTVIYPCKTILCVWHIAVYHKKVIVFKCDYPSLVCMLSVYSKGNGNRLFFSKYGCTRIALFLCAVEIAVIPLRRKIRLTGLHFGFLYAEYVCICIIKEIFKAFLQYCSEAVYIPRYKSHMKVLLA